MTQNHGDGMIYWHWNTSTQLKVMHTAQNYKQKGEANIIYFQVKTLTWWLLQIWEISTWNNWTERALLTGTFICVGTKAVLGGGGEAGRKKDCNRNRKQEHGRKKILSLQEGMKTARFVKTWHQFKTFWPWKHPQRQPRLQALWPTLEKSMSFSRLCLGAAVAGIVM